MPIACARKRIDKKEHMTGDPLYRFTQAARPELNTILILLLANLA